MIAVPGETTNRPATDGIITYELKGKKRCLFQVCQLGASKAQTSMACSRLHYYKSRKTPTVSDQLTLARQNF